MIIDRLFGSLESGDLEAAVGCFSDDARVWHSYDRVALEKSAFREQWRKLIDDFPERRFVDVCREAIPGGFVQRQVMAVVTPTGARMAWPVCMILTLRDGLIVRLDEYIDRAGFFVPAD